MNDVKANFALDGELYWDAIAITLLLAPERTWTGKFGELFSFDELAGALVAASFDDSPCSGTHKLIALAILLRADAETPLLSDPARRSVRDTLARAVELLSRTQLPDGAWQSDWYSRVDNTSLPPLATTNPANHLITTGHHLEWLILLPPDLQISRSTLVLAADRCASLLRLLSADDASVQAHFCPLVHAARSVRQLMLIPTAVRPNDLPTKDK